LAVNATLKSGVMFPIRVKTPSLITPKSPTSNVFVIGSQAA
jgi:hypothetical protein